MSEDSNPASIDPTVSGPETSRPSLAVCILTMGLRPDALADAISSARAGGIERIAVLFNGTAPDPAIADGVEVYSSAENLGVPGGRQHLADLVDADLLFFLDDDATIEGEWIGGVIDRFAEQSDIAVVALRLIDEVGSTSRRHVPRVGSAGITQSGDVATFLGGASVIRRSALEDVGGYWTVLFYGHEELELSWRLYDAGFAVFYDAATTVFHPKTEIGRHADGWFYTGRNRVMIARRDLPWIVAVVHVGVWLVLGSVRAPDRTTRRAYLKGWWTGWRTEVPRSAIGWKTVWRLARAGRPPVV